MPKSFFASAENSVFKLQCEYQKDSAAAKITAFLLALALPTVWLNSAYWGQCDVVFTSLCIGMAYGVLKGKGNLAAVFWALAFSFKLQAIFVLPAIICPLIGMVCRKLGWIKDGDLKLD